MLIRTYLGLDVRSSELRGVALKRRGKGSVLTGGRVLPLANGILHPSSREPNVRDGKRFIESVREVLNPLAGPEERIAVALPEPCGRIILTETETAFKSQDEGLDILKWQLKSSLPVDLKEFQMDYQVLARRDNGRYRLAVAMIAKPVLTQYEELLADAGFSAALVDFHSLNLYNYYRPRLDLGDEFVLLGIESGSFSFQYFQNQLLAFHRVREVDPSPEAVFQEINRSLVGFPESFPGFRRAAVFLHTDWEERQALSDAVGAALEREIISLDPHLERLAQGPFDLAPGRARALVTAIGLAERMM